MSSSKGALRKTKLTITIGNDVSNEIEEISKIKGMPKSQVIFLSTNLRKSPKHVLLQEGEGWLLKASMVKCEQITTVDKSFLIKGSFAGKISSEKIK